MKKKKELDNKEILGKIEKSRIKIKERFNSLINQLNEELKNASSIKKKYELNHFNTSLLNGKMAKLINFKESLIEAGIEYIKEEL